VKTAVIYARYSSERQTEQSIEGQLRVCNDYAARNDIVVVDTYIDRAMTGTNDKRADFQRMLKDSAKRAWDYVLVYKIDRFGRNKYELAMNKHTLKNNGIRLISAMENIPETPEGIILESLLEGMAEYYSAELSQKVKRGMNETRQKGNFTGGRIPYGYKKEGKKIVVDEDKAKIVVYMYEQYAKNVYVKDIIKALTEQGIFYNGKVFVHNTVHHILQCEKYNGIYRVNGEVFTNMYPKIVPDELFQLVQTKNSNNRYGSHSPFVKYLLRKKLYCGYCGRTINGISGTSKSGKTVRYYSCSGRYTRKGCNKSPVRKEPLEDVVLQVITTIFKDNSTIDYIADKIIEANKKRLEDQSILNLLLEELAQITKAKNNLVSAIEQGVVTNTTKERLQELETKEEEISAKILIERTKTKVSLVKKDIVSYLRKAIENSSERIIDLLVKRITMYDDRIVISCKYAKSVPQDMVTPDIPIAKVEAEIPSVSNSGPYLENHKIDVEVKI